MVLCWVPPRVPEKHSETCAVLPIFLYVALVVDVEVTVMEPKLPYEGTQESQGDPSATGTSAFHLALAASYVGTYPSRASMTDMAANIDRPAVGAAVTISCHSMFAGARKSPDDVPSIVHR